MTDHHSSSPGFVRVLDRPNLFIEERAGGLGHEAEMQCNECGRSVTFLNPTPDRVRWFASSHRCFGDNPNAWQGGYR